MNGVLFTRNQIADNTYSLEECAKYAIERTREGKMSYIVVDNEETFDELVQLICDGNVLSREERERIHVAYVTLV